MSQQSSTSTTLHEPVAAYIGVDWADQKHDIALRSGSQLGKVEVSVIEQKPEALIEWISQLQQRFEGQGRPEELAIRAGAGTGGGRGAKRGS